MRKKQKEQVENFIGLLKQAHGQLKKIMEKQDFSEALELLEECQNGAIAMGNLIENTEGEGCRTISMPKTAIMYSFMTRQDRCFLQG